MLLFLFLGLFLFRAAAFDPALQQGPWARVAVGMCLLFHALSRVTLSFPSRAAGWETQGDTQ